VSSPPTVSAWDTVKATRENRTFNAGRFYLDRELTAGFRILKIKMTDGLAKLFLGRSGRLDAQLGRIDQTDRIVAFGLIEVASNPTIAHAADAVTVDIWPLENAST